MAGDPDFESTTITILSGPNFEYIPSLGVSGYVKVEKILTRTLVDCQRAREMVYHRYSYADATSGNFEPLYSIPFGIEHVSG